MKIAIAGYGLEGKASYEYWNRVGNQLTIVDERDHIEGVPDGVATILGQGAFGRLSDFDLIIRSPSVNPGKLPYGEKVWSATNEFFKRCQAPIIGVTGTKGKGTTSSIIASILDAAGKKVHLLGNIGKPSLTELESIQPDDIVVFEMSSFQLWDITQSPDVSVVLKVEPDHLDTHNDMTDYTAAKANIRRYQTPDEACFYHPSNQLSAEVASLVPGAKRYGIADDGAVYVEDGWFKKDSQVLCPVEAMQIPGEHNIENACAAISAALVIIDDVTAVERGLRAFKGLDHRIKYVTTKQDVRFYDDSYSSAPSASVAALRAFDEPKIVLLGGYDKGANFTELAGLIASTETVKKVIIYGQTKHVIAEACRGAGVEPERLVVMDTTDFETIVKQAAAQASDGDVVILSPGCASFDMFKNFTERGERFVEIVNKL